MAFLVAVGALQFVYCVVAGNYVRLLSPPPLPPSVKSTGVADAEIRGLAFQRIPVGVFGDGGAVRFDR